MLYLKTYHSLHEFNSIKVVKTTDNFRNRIIDKLLTINNREYLSALYKIIESGSPDSDVVELSEEQLLMIQMSDDDIKNNRLISYKELGNKDLEWLKGK